MEINDIIRYTLQGSITLGVLFTCYWLLLRKTTFHDLNRIMLILVIVFTIGLPVVSRFATAGPITSIPLLKEIGNKANRYFSAPVIDKAKDLPVRGRMIPGNINLYSVIPLLAGVLYGLGLLFCLSRVIYQVALLYRMARNSPKKSFKSHTLVYINKDRSPFSFFNWIFLHRESYPESQLQHIIGHEQAHVRGYHTLDILLSELFAALLWFHPAAWLLRAQVRLNLEYIADRELLRKGAVRKEYQYSLLNVSFASALTRTASHFNYKHLKKRIAMMNSRPSRTKVLGKYFLIVPVAFLLTTAFIPLNTRKILINPGKMNIYLAIRDDMTEEKLQKIKKYLSEEGIDASFSDLKYNREGSLCGISLSVRQGNIQLGQLTVPNSPHSLSVPLIFYLLRSSQDKSGVSRGYPKGLTEKDLNILESLDGLLKYNPNTKQFDIHGSAHVAE